MKNKKKERKEEVIREGYHGKFKNMLGVPEILLVHKATFYAVHSIGPH